MSEEIKSVHVKKGEAVWISIEGCNDAVSVRDGQIVFIDNSYDESAPSIEVWANKEKEDPTHRIGLYYAQENYKK